MIEPRPPLRARAPLTPPVSVRLAEAAKALGVSIKTVRRMITDGQLAASRLRGSIVIEVRELEALLRRSRIGGPA